MKSKLLKNMQNEKNQELIELLKECNISDSTISMALLGLGTHTAYYRVLYNRVKNNKDKMTETLFKKITIEIFHELDRAEE